MPRRSGRSNLATVGGIALAIGLAAFVVYMDRAGRGYFSQNQQQATAASRDQCVAKLRTLGYGEASEKSQTKNDGEKPPNNDDLCQQIRMAEAAERATEYAGQQVMLGVGNFVLLFAATIAAGFAACYAKQAADAGRRGAQQARRGANAAIGAVNETRKGVALAKFTSETQLRAYLACTAINITDVSPDKTPTVTIEIRNTGFTPAHDLCLDQAVFLDDFPQSMAMAEASRTKRRTRAGIVEPQNMITSHPKAPKLSTDDIEAIRARRRALYVVTSMRYQDAFGKWCHYQRWDMCNHWFLADGDIKAHVCPFGNFYRYDVGEEA